MARLAAWVCVIACAAVVAACGSSKAPRSTSHVNPATSTASISRPPAAVDDLAAAERPRTTEFPAANGRSLRQLGKLVRSTATLGAADGTFTPGLRRFAFGLTDKAQHFVYAPTAVYIATSPNAPARGPFLAPAHSLAVPASARSKQNSGPNGIRAVYSTGLPIPRAGEFDVLTLSRVGGMLVGSPGQIAAAANSPIPGIGMRSPTIVTETLASVHGKVGLLTTRMPPEQMHSVSFNQVLGKRPIALLFSTPQLCASELCGPMTDIMVALQHQFGDRIIFIHQEIYVDNQPNKGLRPQMAAFHLKTEPWLFTINRAGVIAARLEGAFGVDEARRALEAALR